MRGAWLGISKVGFSSLASPGTVSLRPASARASPPPPPLPAGECGLQRGAPGPGGSRTPVRGVPAGRHLGLPGSPAHPVGVSCRGPARSAGARSRAPSGWKPAVSLRVAAAPGTVELGPPFAWEFCTRIGSAVTPQRTGPAAAMVAKDYPFYLSVKRANCSLEVPPASSPAKDAEVGAPRGFSGLARCPCLFPLSTLSISHTYAPGSSLTVSLPNAPCGSSLRHLLPVPVPVPVPLHREQQPLALPLLPQPLLPARLSDCQSSV